MSSSSDPLPVIVLQCIDNAKLDECCKNWGMFRLVNHGIPVALLEQLYHQTAELFSMPFECKQTLFSGPITYFWGTPALTPSGVAIKGDVVLQNYNLVEGFNVSLAQISLIQDKDHMLSSFKVLLEEYGRHLSRISTTIFEAVAKNLQLGPEQTNSYLSPTTGLIRLYHYPCCPEGNQQLWGMDAHTDSSVFTILNQDEVGGLQFFKDDEWLDAKPIPATLIVNIGDMLQAASDDKYSSVRHRVKVSEQKERISIGYFVFPAEDTVIETSRYRPFTYGDFREQVQQDVKSIGCKVGLSRFRMTNTL